MRSWRTTEAPAARRLPANGERDAVGQDAIDDQLHLVGPFPEGRATKVAEFIPAVVRERRHAPSRGVRPSWSDDHHLVRRAFGLHPLVVDVEADAGRLLGERAYGRRG